MADTTLMGGHYRTDIIRGVGYPRSNSVMLLVLCTVACNIQGTGIVLQAGAEGEGVERGQMPLLNP